jgi:hypothetical protein
MGNLKQIATALQAYHATYGCFPPAYVTDARGNRMHSWRVLILPFLGRDDLYKRYRFDEPWNGPNNSKLAALMPPVFHCPSSPQGKVMTDYVAVVGPRTAWPGDKSRKLSEITDDPSVTLLVVESSSSRINWMEPRDLDFDQMSLTLNAASGARISSHHPVGIYVVMADGSVRLMPPKDLPPETVKALLTVDSGEAVKVDW